MLISITIYIVIPIIITLVTNDDEYDDEYDDDDDNDEVPIFLELLLPTCFCVDRVWWTKANGGLRGQVSGVRVRSSGHTCGQRVEDYNF